jgi:hypothetical protein
MATHVNVAIGRAAILVLLACLSGCATRVPPSTTPGKGSTTVLEVREGLASYYGPGLQGKTMASGVRFDMNAMVAAHPRYPFGTVVRVTNLRNGRSVSVRILDRGPAPRIQADGVSIDGPAAPRNDWSSTVATCPDEVPELGDP